MQQALVYVELKGNEKRGTQKLHVIQPYIVKKQPETDSSAPETLRPYGNEPLCTSEQQLHHTQQPSLPTSSDAERMQAFGGRALQLGPTEGSNKNAARSKRYHHKKALYIIHE